MRLSRRRQARRRQAAAWHWRVPGAVHDGGQCLVRAAAGGGCAAAAGQGGQGCCDAPSEYAAHRSADARSAAARAAEAWHDAAARRAPRAIRQDAPRIAPGLGAVHTQPQRRGRRDPGIQHAADRRLPLCPGDAARRPRAIDTDVAPLARPESGRADTAPAHESGRRRLVPQRAIDAAVDADAQSCVTASLARYPILWSCRPSRPMRRTCRPDCGPDTPCACGPHAAC